MVHVYAQSFEMVSPFPNLKTERKSANDLNPLHTDGRLPKVGTWISGDLCWCSFFLLFWNQTTVIFQLSGLLLYTSVEHLLCSMSWKWRGLEGHEVSTTGSSHFASLALSLVPASAKARLLSHGPLKALDTFFGHIDVPGVRRSGCFMMLIEQLLRRRANLVLRSWQARAGSKKKQTRLNMLVRSSLEPCSCRAASSM